VREFSIRAEGMMIMLRDKGACVAEPVPAGSDVSAGTYECTSCGYRIDVDSTKHVPPCPSCGNGEWRTISGGDSVQDPYPDRSR